MVTERRASVVINNFNYGRFLGPAIDSALAQTWANIEIIVVDDGSTDESRDVIAGYGSRIVPILKENGGQGSAFNHGFERSSGDAIFFLDADDLLRPEALATAMPALDDPAVVKVQWRMRVADASGKVTDRLLPKRPPPSGDLLDQVVARGPDQYEWSPGGGSLWSRQFLEAILPLREDLYTHGADCPLFQLAPYLGRIETIRESLSLYRFHKSNDSRTLGFDRELERQIAFFEDYSATARRLCDERGLAYEFDAWRSNSWWCQLKAARDELVALLPSDSRFILVDEGIWGLERLGTRDVIPFVDRHGYYGGKPADSASAMRELERSRSRGADFIVFGWHCFWMLEHYARFADRIRENFPCVIDNERLRVFCLR